MAAWDITLQVEADWQNAFENLPAELLSDDLQMRFAASEETPKDAAAPLRGYKLPWAQGVSHRLTGSIGHFLVYNSCSEASCRYAYDFAEPDNTETLDINEGMFPLLAARGGVVYTFKTTCTNGDTGCTNYLVLKDESTSPTTYQLYMHMAYNTVPTALRSVDARVAQGQFIGNVDDTGYSSGHHLHFMVYYTPTSSSWGNSIDIRFDDVSINDGTPRTCSEAHSFPNYGTQCNTGDRFTSGNKGANPPSGDLILPAAGETITSAALSVGGWARDDLGIQKIQILARPKGGLWQVVGEAPNSATFLTDINLCDAGIPPGALDISARIFDLEGNMAPGYPGLRTVINNAVCHQVVQPACAPNANQVALYDEPNYQGACQLFGEGDFNDGDSLGAVANDHTASLLVGSNMRALLYDYPQNETWSSGGRSQAFEANDANLSDNPIGDDSTSALRVMARSTFPNIPAISTIFNDTRTGLNSAELYVVDFLSYGAVTYRAELSGPVSKSLALTEENAWSFGSLPAGNYSLRVWAHNSAGEKDSTKTFTIANGTLPNNTQINAPFNHDFESSEQGWYGMPMWHRADVNLGGRATKAWIFNDGFDVNAAGNLGHSKVGGGDLTSAPIRIPGGGYYLRYEYYYQTETPYSFWDQRWLQISVDGGAFQNLAQLTYDPMEAWLTSASVNLSAYSGKTIRLRFHMDIVDRFYNEGFGWMVDNIRIEQSAPAGCNDAEPNNTFAQATPFPASGQASGFICPSGDLDYYRFSAGAGDQYVFDIDAMDFGSHLDPYLYLYDSQGHLLVENDDEIYSQARDAKFSYVFSNSGTYYLMVKAWDHPGVGGADYYYSLYLTRTTDTTVPSLTFLSPSSGYIPNITFPLQVNAGDSSGVKRVDFFWQAANILDAPWVSLGHDSNGADGWSVSFDPRAHEPIANGTLYAQALDEANNQQTIMRTVLGYVAVSQPPSSQMQALPANLQTTLIALKWSGSDPQGLLSGYDLQVKVDAGSWQALQLNIPAAQTSYDYLGEMGKHYEFRLRAMNYGGKYEAYPDNAEVSVTLPSACDPDGYEADGDQPAGKAAGLAADSSQEHNFCAIPGYLNDEDWVALDVQAGTTYLIFATSQSGGAAMRLKLYAADGSTLLKEQASASFGQSALMRYTAAENSRLYLDIIPLDGRLAGTDVRYSIWYGAGSTQYLPLMNR